MLHLQLDTVSQGAYSMYNVKIKGSILYMSERSIIGTTFKVTPHQPHALKLSASDAHALIVELDRIAVTAVLEMVSLY